MYEGAHLWHFVFAWFRPFSKTALVGKLAWLRVDIIVEQQQIRRYIMHAWESIQKVLDFIENNITQSHSPEELSKIAAF